MMIVFRDFTSKNDLRLLEVIQMKSKLLKDSALIAVKKKAEATNQNLSQTY